MPFSVEEDAAQGVHLHVVNPTPDQIEHRHHPPQVKDFYAEEVYAARELAEFAVALGAVLVRVGPLTAAPVSSYCREDDAQAVHHLA